MAEGDDEAVDSISYLFDDESQTAATARFLNAPGHHLLVAYDDTTAVGFVTGVEMTHPDKGTEMFLYELGVDEGARNRGVGTALVAALADRARSAGCYGCGCSPSRTTSPQCGRIRPPAGSTPNNTRCSRGPLPRTFS